MLMSGYFSRNAFTVAPVTELIWIVPKSCARSSFPPLSFIPLMVSSFPLRVVSSDSLDTENSNPIIRVRHPAGRLPSMVFTLMPLPIFSRRSVVRFSSLGSTKSVIPGCPMIDRFASVPGRCRVLIMPPFGRSTPVMEVPSK